MRRSTVRRLDWKTATTLGELGALTARYLAGEADEHPLYAGPPAGETREILEPLTVLNRAGLVTVMSQPARSGPDWQQRAGLVAYCDWLTLTKVVLACTSAGLETIAMDPRDRPRWRRGFCGDIPITMMRGQPHTRIGTVASTAQLRRAWAGELSRAGMDCLLAAHEMHVWDPEWGRRDALWDTLTRTVR